MCKRLNTVQVIESLYVSQLAVIIGRQGEKIVPLIKSQALANASDFSIYNIRDSDLCAHLIQSGNAVRCPLSILVASKL
jgi:hypothetical protein